MALKSSVHKLRMNVSNLNIHHYEEYSLTVAKHPSENNLRMVIRILAFAFYAQEDIQFTKGLSSDSEPDIWKINFDGSIAHWIELGIPEEKRLRQSCSKAQKVSLFTYHGKQAEQWFQSMSDHIQRFDHLNIIHFMFDDPEFLASFGDKSMDFEVSIEDNEIWLSSQNDRTLIHYEMPKKSLMK